MVVFEVAVQYYDKEIQRDGERKYYIFAHSCFDAEKEAEMLFMTSPDITGKILTGTSSKGNTAMTQFVFDIVTKGAYALPDKMSWVKFR